MWIEQESNKSALRKKGKEWILWQGERERRGGLIGDDISKMYEWNQRIEGGYNCHNNRQWFYLTTSDRLPFVYM